MIIIFVISLLYIATMSKREEGDLVAAPEQKAKSQKSRPEELRG